MKKSITIVLIIAILVNTVFPNFIYASGYGTYDEAQEHQQQGDSINDKLWEEGSANVTSSTGSRTEDVNETQSSSNLIANVLCWIIALIPQSINAILTIVVHTTQEEGYASALGTTENVMDEKFTIESLVLGKYSLFDIDFFRYNDSTENEEVTTVLKRNVAKWYFALRNIAMAISLLVLIYIGIRMAISTVASEQAKYKKMFASWVTSFILLFAMQYIVIFLIELQQSLLELVSTWAKGKGFEEQIVSDIWQTLKSSYGWNNVWVVIELCMIVYYQIKFFIVYMKRVLETGFLLTISPLVTITYSIDKAGDGKAQAYGAWLSKMIYNIFIQLIHAIIYIVFIFSAAEIAKTAPIIGILFLTTLSRIEKIIKTTFGLKGKGLNEEKLLDKIKKG